MALYYVGPDVGRAFFVQYARKMYPTNSRVIIYYVFIVFEMYVVRAGLEGSRLTAHYSL